MLYLKSRKQGEQMKVDFYFTKYGQPEIKETFFFLDNATEQEIEQEFEQWWFNELDRAGIEGHYEIRL